MAAGRDISWAIDQKQQYNKKRARKSPGQFNREDRISLPGYARGSNHILAHQLQQNFDKQVLF